MAISYQGPLYRALNPVYARDPLSGRGAELDGGRFNSKGVPALYTSLSIMVALKEANQVGHLQPTTLVSYEADIDGIFDGRDVEALAAEGMAPSALATSTWRDEMRAKGEAKTQAFARTLIASGHNGLMVPSYVPGSRTGDLNLVLWRWGAAAPARLTLIDDENRLGR